MDKEEIKKDINRTKKNIILLSCITILPCLGITFNLISGLIGWIGLILVICTNLFFIIRLTNLYKRS